MDFKKFTNNSFDIWRAETQHGKLVTRFKALDDYFDGGGISMRKITEFCGMSGTGKTQMCLQLCLNIQIPVTSGGFAGKAIFIDTRQDFNPARLQELATHMAARFASKEPTFNVDHMLSNVHYIYCGSYAALAATVISLPKLVEKEPNFKLVIIDSFSFALRMLPNVKERTSLLYELMEEIYSLTRIRDLTVIITNEMTNRLINGKYKLVPALGDTHAHLINERIILSRISTETDFLAAVGKSLDTCRIIGKFEISASGIKGVGMLSQEN